jgi:chromosomal replication initiator protein
LELPAHVDELAPVWRDIRAELQRAVGQSTYELWLAPLEIKSWDGTVLALQVPVATQSWVVKRFGRIVENCASRVIGRAVRVSFDVGRSPTESTRSTHTEASRHGTVSLNPRFSFDQFIIGEGNRLAHAAALAVAEIPGQAYNPLFLHAPPGLGKTHLLHAIGNYILSFGGGTAVRFTTAEAFTNHFISSLSSRSVAGFKHAYRDADVLLIDDVQFLASKAKTGEEFFHTFNALHETGRQLVLTCDRLPARLHDVEERLRERFESGLVADILPPDFHTRLAILRKRTELDHVPLADSAVLELIAERITDNVRALEGALIRVVAHHSLTGQPIDVSLTRFVLDGVRPQRRGASTPIAVTDIQETVASYYNLSIGEMLCSSRAARFAWPRHLAIYLARELTDAPLQQLGRSFGGRNHATVVNACRRVKQRIREDAEAARDVENLSQSLLGMRDDRDC